MKRSIFDELKRELVLHGFGVDGKSPHDTMVLDDVFLNQTEIGDLLDTMVARREKLFHSTGVVGPEIARNGYEDVVLVIDAIKSVMTRMSLP